ncbi:MAG: methyltransferase domain-containing protein [Thermogemmatispora sp.]|jgi:ubiquinone/menaquinone biosynthesis C-methylase UbiE|uniref:Methyltransferase n=1 Tax=Thermogemmatispora aurantia TaxID=2045279 RepID=A0A5J4K835_9CHLR|nr:MULTISPECIES: class I SAM-dependent methyltransferase [Thermogemmatispora]MBE3566130.1 methyltransferase domain-containing protein [Thermogemmatispora sp.]GER82869.1 methyltransferase [Thermogemmatispora aurantia]
MASPDEHDVAGQEAGAGSTYHIDTEQAAELARLMQQNRLAIEAMGGIFPEELALPQGGRVLDLACGPGGWVLEGAFLYPQADFIGVDISASMIEYARAQAQSRRLENASFLVMDVMKPMSFPDASFDVINGRLLSSFMLPAAWPELLKECWRLLKPGGVLCLTDTEGPLTNSEATERFFALGFQALKRAGQSFSPDGRHIGITPQLAPFLRQAGFEQVRLRASALDWSSESPAHYSFFKDVMILLEVSRPFLVQMGLATAEELERLAQQALAEMQADDFRGLVVAVVAWGRKPA